MKYLLLIISLFSYAAHAQSWTKLYVATTGDTIKRGTAVWVSDTSSLTYIYPHYYDAHKAPVMAQNLEKYRRYLTMHMSGKWYKIHRLSRIRDVKTNKKSYIHIATIRVSDYHLDPFNAAEFTIEIENALKNGEIAVVK